MNRKTPLYLAMSALVGFAMSASAEEIFLFDATPITNSAETSPDGTATVDINKRFVYDSAETTVFCASEGTAHLRTVDDGNNYLIVDNYVTLNDADTDSICTGGGSVNGGIISGTHCFNSGSSSSSVWGDPIAGVFNSTATAPVDLVDGRNDLMFKLWDYGAVYGNTALELALPENCSSEPPFEVSLCAAQDLDVGVVSVDQDGDNLYVSFEIEEPGWYLAETHVAVGDIPTNRGGNPQPGQFPYSCEDSGTLDASELQYSCVATIPLDELSGEVDIAAHASVFQLAGDGCKQATQYASEVVNSLQTFTKDGSFVLENRSDPEAVFNPGGLFFSPGLGGELTVGFGAPVFNAPGIDVCIQEVTNGRPTYPEENAELYGVTDESDSFLGEVSNRANGTGLACVDLSSETADAIKVVDSTNPDIHSGNADGYDIDWIGACYLYLGDETAWGAACYEGEGERITDRGNWGTFFKYEIK